MAGRYVRLIIPIGIASLICFIALKVKLIPPPALRPENYKNYLAEIPKFLDFFQFHFWEVLYQYNGQRSLIPPLWTMQIEFLGSIYVLCSMILIDNLKFKPFFIIILGLISIQLDFHYSLFFIGVLLAWIYSRYPFVNKIFIGYLSFFIALLSSWFFNYFDSYEIFTFIFQVLCLSSFFIAAMYCKPVKSFLSSPLSIYLGKISFFLYLIHSVVMWTIGLRLINSIGNVWIDCIGVLTSLILAHYLTFFDMIGIRLSREIGALILKLELPEKNNSILTSNVNTTS